MTLEIIMQRLRIRFSRGEELKFISHLDVMRLWYRAFVRAGIPIAYSEGFNPHPRISIAVPLAIGMTSEAELMDIMVTREVSPHWFMSNVNGVLPAGIRVLQVFPISLTQPAVQAQIGFAEYRVEVATTMKAEETESALNGLLALEHLPWQHQRDTGVRSYDLRPLIDDLWLEGCQGESCTIGMKLRCDSSGAGRPEQVAAALGFNGYPSSVHRIRLILKGTR